MKVTFPELADNISKSMLKNHPRMATRLAISVAHDYARALMKLSLGNSGEVRSNYVAQVTSINLADLMLGNAMDVFMQQEEVAP